MARSPKHLRVGSVRMDDRSQNLESADKALLETTFTEEELLQSFCSPPGVGTEGWVEKHLSLARASAQQVNLGAWEVIGYLERHGFGYLIDSQSFASAKQLAGKASPSALASWLTQWKRPEIWLAALFGINDLKRLITLVAHVQRLPQPVNEECLAALLWLTLDRANNEVYEQERRINDLKDDEGWETKVWPDIAENLAVDLLHTSPGQSLAVDMLALGDITRDTPRHHNVRQCWHDALARHLPNEAFKRLFLKATTESPFRFASLKSLALVATTHPDATPDWAQSVITAFSRLPLKEWRGHGHFQFGNREFIHAAHLLGACIASVPEPISEWLELWNASHPGPSDGWPADLEDWQEKRTLTGFIEWAGICASAEPKADPLEKRLPVYNIPLFQEIESRVLHRLSAAAGEYQELDKYVLQLLWLAGGSKAISRTVDTLADCWSAELSAEFGKRF